MSISRESLDRVARTECPKCSTKSLKIEWHFVPNEFGTYSLAGVQSKIVAKAVPTLLCTNCGAKALGRKS